MTIMTILIIYLCIAPFGAAFQAVDGTTGIFKSAMLGGFLWPLLLLSILFTLVVRR